LPSGLQLGVGVRPVATERMHTQGSLQQTGNALDVAINGRGFFQVLLPDGTTGYTRDGSFQTDSQGTLVTASGFAVQPNITIPADALEITVARDGTVSVTQPGVAAPTTLGQLQLATFVNPAGLQSQGETFTPKPPPRGRRRSMHRAPTAWACSTRASWKTPTSMSPRNWST
jgi:flagellar basal-body rod protein FlgG